MNQVVGWALFSVTPQGDLCNEISVSLPKMRTEFVVRAVNGRVWYLVNLVELDTLGLITCCSLVDSRQVSREERTGAVS